MSQKPNEETQGKTGEQVEYGGPYAAVSCCRTTKKLGQGDTFPACPQHGQHNLGMDSARFINRFV